MARRKICGIYCIENVVNNKKYIGLSLDIYKRWQDHKYELRNNIHINSYLQRSWNKHGEGNFKFYILKKSKEEYLDSFEKEYIKMFKSNNEEFGYNLTNGGSGYFKINKNIFKKKSKNHSKKVIQFDVNMKPLCEHINARYAGKLYGMEETSSGIYQVCNGITDTAYGYKWRFKDDCFDKYDLSKIDKPSIKKYPRIIHKSKKVVKLNKNGDILNVYSSLGNANEDIGRDRDNDCIRLCCSGEIKTSNGFYWMYEYDYIKYGFDINKYKHKTNAKPVAKIDKNTGEILKIYNSARQADKKDGYKYKGISKACVGYRKTYMGFVWKFVEDI